MTMPVTPTHDWAPRAGSPHTAAPVARLTATVPAERPVLFRCEGERLLGILHPADGRVGIVVIIGGPQYRAGSHRYFVQLARAVAAAGHPVLRFDARGMGDSSGELHTFEHITSDIGAAINAMVTQQPQVQGVVLWGLCDAASAALLYLHDHADTRVVGLVLLNPWVRSPTSLARTHVKHYYRRRLMQREFWSKLFSGRIALNTMQDLWQALSQARGSQPRSGPTPSNRQPEAPPATFHARMSLAWKAFPGKIVIILSENDFTAKEFIQLTSDSPEWTAAFSANAGQWLNIPNADHTFSGPELADAPFEATMALASSLQQDMRFGQSGPELVLG